MQSLSCTLGGSETSFALDPLTFYLINPSLVLARPTCGVRAYCCRSVGPGQQVPADSRPTRTPPSVPTPKPGRSTNGRFRVGRDLSDAICRPIADSADNAAHMDTDRGLAIRPVEQLDGKTARFFGQNDEPRARVFFEFLRRYCERNSTSETRLKHCANGRCHLRLVVGDRKTIVVAMSRGFGRSFRYFKTR